MFSRCPVCAHGTLIYWPGPDDRISCFECHHVYPVAKGLSLKEGLGMREGWIRTDAIFEKRIRAFPIGMPFLRELDINFDHPEWFHQLDEQLKKISMVPKTAWMRGYFFIPHQDKLIVQYIDASFLEVPQGGMIPEYDVSYEWVWTDGKRQIKIKGIGPLKPTEGKAGQG